jgi:hypothetical protein
MNKLLVAIVVALAVFGGLAVAGFADLPTVTTATQTDSGTEGTLAASLTFELTGLSKDISVNGNFRDNSGGFPNDATSYLKLYDDETGTLLIQKSFNTGSNDGYMNVTFANHTLDKAVRRVRLDMTSSEHNDDVTMKDVSLTYTYDNDPVNSWKWGTSANQTDGGGQGSLASSLTFELPVDGTTAIVVRGSYRDSWQAADQPPGPNSKSRIKVSDDETGKLLMDSGWVQINGHDDSAHARNYAEPIVLSNYSLANPVRRVRVDMFDQVADDAYVDMFDVAVSYKQSDTGYRLDSSVTTMQNKSGNEPVSVTFNLNQSNQVVIIRGSFRDSNTDSGWKSQVTVKDADTGSVLASFNGVINSYEGSGTFEPIVLSNWSTGGVKKVKVEMTSGYDDSWVEMKNVYVEYASSSTLIGTINRDVDADGSMETATDADGDNANGFETYADTDGSSTASSIDGDGDGKTDFLVDTDKDGVADVYWDPDGDVLTDVTAVDVDDDGNLELLLDTDGDGTIDTLYDPDTGTLTPVTGEDVNGDGNVDLILDTDGDGTPDTWYNPTDGTVKQYPHGNVSRDVDADGNMETATDTDDDSTNGFETYADTDGSSTAVGIDGDGDGKTDFLVDTDKDGVADVYWDPDGDVLTDVTAVDVDDDGNVDLLLDTDGDGNPDTWYNPADGSVNPYPVDNGNNQPPDNGNGGSGGGGGGGGGSSGGSSGTNGGGTTVAVRDFDLSIAPSSLEMQAGNMALLTITLHNSGTAALSGITFEVSGLPDGWYIVPGSIPALGFTDQVAEWKIEVPAGTAAGNYDVKLTANSSDGTADTATFLLSIKEPVPAEEPEVEPQNEQPSPLTSLLTMVNSPLAITALVITALAAATAFKQRDRVAKWYHQTERKYI